MRNWRCIVEAEIYDNKLKEEFVKLTDKEEKSDIKDFITIEPLKKEDVIWGFILAYKCPVYGGYYCLYVETLVVNSDIQGNGIGRMLLEKLKENLYENRIYSIKLMTQREIKAYKIYKHLGFDEIEEYVHMKQ